MIKKKNWTRFVSNQIWSNYETRSEVKNVTGVDTLDFSGKDDLGGLKSDIGEQNIDKIKLLQLI